MRAVWATLLSVWALFAIVAFLAWTRQQPTPARSPQSVPGAVIVKGKNGTTRLVVVSGAATSGAPHATTRTSPVPVG
jgi:cyanate permease